MELSETDARLRLQQEYLLQQNMELNEKNIAEFTMEMEYVSMLYELEDVWILLFDDPIMNRVLNIVYKDKRVRMASVEI